MTYDLTTQHSSPNHSGPRPGRVTGIVIHHWGVRGQRFDSVVRFLCTPWQQRSNKSQSSAHYVAEAGRVACIVDPDRVAWHAGNRQANERTIGIECRPEATDADYATVAELVADLRAVYGDVPLSAHRDYKSTACPGVWDLARIDREARKNTTPTKSQEDDDMDPEYKKKIDRILDLVDDKVIDGPAGKPKEQDRLSPAGGIRRVLIETGAAFEKILAKLDIIIANQKKG